MAKTTNSIRSYFLTTHTLLYSYLISLPLLLAYEVLIYIAQPNAEQIVRISVDVWVKTLFSYVGQDVLSITLIFVALLGIYVLYSERNRLSSLKLRYFGVMILESSVYAFILGLLLTVTVSNLLQMVQTSPMESLSIIQQLALSLGAGLYEELFFRVILVTSLLYIFKRLFSNNYISWGSAIILAALIFSFVHYVGVMGDPFTFGSFLFRFLFGLALNAIYLWRGFGIAAWTHAIYDLMVIIY
ncbi:CPBP family intramembrane glutamic endopeptidase [Fodinibius halophilus]|uniref:CPBP family intramembrane metalloprotease n=1 Tax=Fodinibius halophilus TaxID=1736908 RepID=A0A6M1SXK4_9BACT|nr:CPBP family intramembrane glutamic endopeptidase [Fodinibius halophilus]NGP88638.1 CPBP family intramembrane metalloprotease [Fodinibius halophilus]